MRFVLSETAISKTACDLLALPVPVPGTLSGLAAEVDRATGGRLAELACADGFSGRRGRAALFHVPEAPFRRVLLVGIGDEAGAESLRRYAAAAVRRARDVGASRVALATEAGSLAGEPPDEGVRAVVEGAGLGAYRFDRYRATDETAAITETLLVAAGGDRTALDRAIRTGEVAVVATCRARDLVNEPANVLTPAALAEASREIAAHGDLDLTIIELAEARAMGMGLFAAVAAGSEQPPKFIVLEYRPNGRGRTGAAGSSHGRSAANAGHAGPMRTIAIIGKGITFDSGGLSIKSAGGMRMMKGDMAGAAAVVATMGALRDCDVPVRVLGIAAATENMISGRATRPGDIVRGLGGKTVEIVNTDAEGRLVLADALAYAVRAGADEIIDLATLTGSCVVALGDWTAGLMGNDQPLMDRLLRAAALAGEQLWQLPLYEEFGEAMRGEISDLKNSAGREAGAERAAAFLREFAGATPWAHLDIAGPAFAEDKGAAPYLTPGGTGYGVRTLLRYLASPM
jgi:leucyl aminopeptidase